MDKEKAMKENIKGKIKVVKKRAREGVSWRNLEVKRRGKPVKGHRRA